MRHCALPFLFLRKLAGLSYPLTGLIIEIKHVEYMTVDCDLTSLLISCWYYNSIIKHRAFKFTSVKIIKAIGIIGYYVCKVHYFVELLKSRSPYYTYNSCIECTWQSRHQDRPPKTDTSNCIKQKKIHEYFDSEKYYYMFLVLISRS